MAAIKDSQAFRCADQRETDGTFVAEMRCDPALYVAIEKSPEY
jgi:hypothetical protein